MVIDSVYMDANFNSIKLTIAELSEINTFESLKKSEEATFFAAIEIINKSLGASLVKPTFSALKEREIKEIHKTVLETLNMIFKPTYFLHKVNKYKTLLEDTVNNLNNGKPTQEDVARAKEVFAYLQRKQKILNEKYEKYMEETKHNPSPPKTPPPSPSDSNNDLTNLLV